MVGDGVVALAEEPQEALPLLERVVVLPHQEAHEAELKLGQDLVGPERVQIQYKQIIKSPPFNLI